MKVNLALSDSPSFFHLPSAGITGYPIMPGVYDTGDRTQVFVHAQQAHPRLLFSVSWTWEPQQVTNQVNTEGAFNQMRSSEFILRAHEQRKKEPKF